MTDAELLAMCQERGGVVGQSLAEVMAGNSAPVIPGPAKDISEKDFMSMVVKYAEQRGWHVYHTYLSIRSKAGYPDLTMVRGFDKRKVWAELKDETGKLSKAQEKWFNVLEAAGAEVYLWRPSNWPVIQEVLK